MIGLVLEHLQHGGFQRGLYDTLAWMADDYVLASSNRFLFDTSSFGEM